MIFRNDCSRCARAVMLNDCRIFFTFDCQCLCSTDFIVHRFHAFCLPFAYSTIAAATNKKLHRCNKKQVKYSRSSTHRNSFRPNTHRRTKCLCTHHSPICYATAASKMTALWLFWLLRNEMKHTLIANKRPSNLLHWADDTLRKSEMRIITFGWILVNNYFKWSSD